MREIFKNIEPQDINKVEFGKNVEIRALFRRHTEYDKETGELTNQGKETAQIGGESFVPLSEGDRYLVKGAHSGYTRTEQVENILLDNINSDRKGSNRVDLELGNPAEDFFIPDLDGFLEKGQVVINDQTITTKEIAAKVATRIDKFIGISKKLKENSKVDVINITHLPWILSFLKEVAEDDLTQINPVGQTFMEKIGGTVGYLEGFDVLIKRSDKEHADIALDFRDQKINIPYERLENLIEKDEKNK